MAVPPLCPGGVLLHEASHRSPAHVAEALLDRAHHLHHALRVDAVVHLVGQEAVPQAALRLRG
ncbi:hypothetical protein EBU58_15960, partial [bacterium]|nr:hypothetical protein [bacterium]